MTSTLNSFALFRLSLTPGSLIYYVNGAMASTVEPHFHVIIGEAEGAVLMVPCTSRYDSILKYIELRGFPVDTLALVMPSDQNELKHSSYLNCNRVYSESPEALYAMYQNDSLRIRGNVTQDECRMIITGVTLSPLVEGYIIAALSEDPF